MGLVASSAKGIVHCVSVVRNSLPKLRIESALTSISFWWHRGILPSQEPPLARLPLFSLATELSENTIRATTLLVYGAKVYHVLSCGIGIALSRFIFAIRLGRERVVLLVCTVGETCSGAT